ncbi:hypothetical protein [Methyloversatilis sp. XJ19-49]|uniref:hypothetical protein n=1 Tax=Methyloversatilis sp. XJ19-49 TaxID=2963429 RepID=UPI00211C679C|nr:hypothetical protein [Methyloversatilis sp. XJ19-49]MCQ9377755.1 hypothetical protein [Methyloversatilis sp. XJ19-49]
MAFAAPFRQRIQDDTLIQTINVDFGEASGTYIDTLDAFVVYGTGLSGEIDKIAVSGIFEISGLAFFSEDNTALDIVASPVADIMAIGSRPLLQSSLPPFEILSATGVFDSADPVSYLSFATGLAGSAPLS